MDYHFNNFDLQSYNDYPQAAVNNAKRALDWAKENGWGSCGTPVGKKRANQLAKKERITVETIARMASFARHRQNKDVPYSEGCGGLMWDAWGGTAGIEWAQRKLRKIDRQNLSLEFDDVELSEEVKPNTNIITKMKEHKFEIDVLEVLGRYGVEMNEDIEILFSEEVSDFDEEILLKKEEDILEAFFLEKKINGLFVYYKYDVKDELGPKVISTTRDFCKTMIKRNKLYTKEELMKMKNDMKDFNSNVFKYKGGWYRKKGTIESTTDCRHTWKRILTRKKQNVK